MNTIPVRGILETALYVADLAASEAFYHRLFGWPTALADDRLRALRIASDQVLLLFARGQSVSGEDTPRGRIPGHDGGGMIHLALRIDADAVQETRTRLASHGVVLESHVRPEQGGDSLYLRDPDKHLIELATGNIWNV